MLQSFHNVLILNMVSMRIFIAIPIPEDICLFLTNIQDEIRKNRVKASWTRRSSMHLTLRFLGDTEKRDAKEIIRAMKSTAVTCASFTLSAQGVGVFPGIRKARVIWSGVKGQIDQLGTVRKILENNLHQAGIKTDNKRFSPHFTLGRFKGHVDGRTVANIIQNFQMYESDVCLIKSMVLFKSDLRPSGAVHTPLFEAVLSGV